MIKKISLIILIIVYMGGGINHFLNPASYIRIIPVYLPFPALLNMLAGIFEISFAALLIFDKTRSLAAWGIILMLIAFIPVHIDMLMHSPMQLGKINLTPVIAWIRLLLQPVLMLWAWSVMTPGRRKPV
jgi:uncharacterized membrane protein